MDSILEQLDFDATCDLILTNDAQIPPPGYYDVVVQVEEAAAQGKLLAVMEAFATLRCMKAEPGQCLTISAGSCSLYIAVKNGRKEVVESLLAEGVPVGPNHAMVATLNKDTAVLELFLKYG
ncbi:hypothetical protein LTR36_005860 [Oleoguttula mirabilis]|uniref:Uncharacterized protein n=1 Tax=Oleoguttula mirabilis TaxID=1507867 RepID=A0AAV9JCU5_9PEZI|nr:hypothetical protein LTR36_005860 [Oleoguttula mirabilis]